MFFTLKKEFVVHSFTTRFVLAVVALAMAATIGFAQSGADAKARGRYDFYGKSAQRSMRSARDYSRDYRQHVQVVSPTKVDGEVAKEAADSIGTSIVKAQKDVDAIRKNAGDDKETLASLDIVSKKLADAAKHHKAMNEICCKDEVDADGSMACCKDIDEALEAAIAEHEKVMKRLGVKDTAATEK